MDGKSNPGDKHYSCSMCLQQFKFAGSLRRHLKSEHGSDAKTEKAYKCSYCSESYGNSEQLKKHMSKHLDEDFVYLKHNQKSRDREEGDEQYDYNNQQKPPKRSRIQEETANNNADRLDIKSEEIEPDREKGGNEPSESKNESYIDKSNRVRKRCPQIGEAKTKLHTCKECGQQVKGLKALMDHMGQHSQITHFECFKCQKHFKNANTYKRHLKSHGMPDPYVCGICGSGLEDYRKLKAHMAIHTGVMPYTCDICHKGFGYCHNLKTHRNTHSTERKKFECTQCIPVKLFQLEKNLKTHIRNTHMNEKAFKCDKCDEEFPDYYTRNTHRKRKHGKTIGDYVCELCGWSYNTTIGLKAHMTRKHKDVYLEYYMDKDAKVLTYTMEQRMEKPSGDTSSEEEDSAEVASTFQGKTPIVIQPTEYQGKEGSSYVQQETLSEFPSLDEQEQPGFLDAESGIKSESQDELCSSMAERQAISRAKLDQNGEIKPIEITPKGNSSSPWNQKDLSGSACNSKRNLHHISTGKKLTVSGTKDLSGCADNSESNSDVKLTGKRSAVPSTKRKTSVLTKTKTISIAFNISDTNNSINIVRQGKPGLQQCSFCNSRYTDTTTFVKHINEHRLLVIDGEMSFEKGVYMEMVFEQLGMDVLSVSMREIQSQLSKLNKNGYRNVKVMQQPFNVQVNKTTRSDCETCVKGFNSRTELQTHLSEHTPLTIVKLTRLLIK